MTSKVFFAPLTADEPLDAIRSKVAWLCEAAGFPELVSEGDLVALKIHFGEEGNHNFIDPQQLTPLVGCLQSRGGKPFWTETSTLYVGERANAVDHALLAHRHGFGIEATGIPTLFSDGLSGRDEVEVSLDAARGKRVRVAEGVASADALFAISHATGHVAAGYGGALKNLGMGLSSRKGKLYQHSVVQPFVTEAACRGCGNCARWCPAHAISMVEVPVPEAQAPRRHARLDPEACIGCGECLASCRLGAIGFEWEIGARQMQERMIEQAAGVLQLKKGRVGFLTFITRVGRDCDCLPSREQDVLIDALGILASKDVLAIEHATLDLIEARLGVPLDRRSHPIDFRVQLEHARALGLGEPEYELVTRPETGA